MPVDSAILESVEEAQQGTSEPYASFDVEASDVEPLQPWRSRWLGRIFVYNVGGKELYIGPHWYCSLIMLAFILAVGGYNCTSVDSVQDFLGGISVTVLTVVSFARCVFSDPGVLLKSPPELLEAMRAQEAGGNFNDDVSLGPTARRHLRDKSSGRTCQKCNVLQPKGCVHCSFCQVCVLGHDHHCPWMGKCIGKQNLCKFYTFLIVAFSSLGYVFVIQLMAPLTKLPPIEAQEAVTPSPWEVQPTESTEVAKAVPAVGPLSSAVLNATVLNASALNATVASALNVSVF